MGEPSTVLFSLFGVLDVTGEVIMMWAIIAVITIISLIIKLTLKEYDLLEKFMAEPCRVFSREQHLMTVWGDDFPGGTRTVDVHIGTLRTKLGECGKYIETVRGIGYRLEEKK